MTATAQSTKFTKGSLLWPLLTLAAPLMGTKLLQILYNFTDIFWVGRLGPDAVSAVSFAWPVVFLIISIGGGITNAGTILVSQNTGAGNDKQARHVAGQTFVLVALISVVFAVVGFIFTPQLLQLIGTTPETAIHEMAVSYTRIAFLGLPFTFGFFIFQSLLQGWGDTKTPMYLAIGSVVLNVILDPFFILGFKDNPLFTWMSLGEVQQSLFAATGFAGFGVEGAAVATLLARGLAAGIGLWLLFSGRVGISLSLSDLKPNVTIARRVVRIGAPLSIEQITNSLSVIVMTALVALIGTDAVAAYGIGNRYMRLVWFPTVAMGMAVETVVGQNLGDNRLDRAHRTVYLAIAMLATVALLISGLTIWFARPIMDLFITGEGSAAVIRHGIDYLRIIAPTWVLMTVYHMMNGAFCGAGATRLSMILNISTQWGLSAAIAAVLVLVGGFGATGVWYGIALSNVIAVVVGSAIFVRGHWSRDSLENNADDTVTVDEDHSVTMD
jgi:putative MATE family efflux protein